MLTISETTITFDYGGGGFPNGEYEADGNVWTAVKGKDSVEFVLAEDNILVVTWRGDKNDSVIWIKYQRQP